MNSEAWARLSEWHNAWLDASPDDREQLRLTFVADHPALEADVRDLVLAGPILPGFLETPAFALVLNDLADEETPLASGTLVGPYQIVTLIAAGGMGQVYRATDVRLGRDVAIKLLSRADRHDRDLVERFLQEARITAAIDRPNIVRLFDVGIHDDRPYLVMELLVGETLRERLARGRLPPDEIRRVALDVAHGLTAAHAADLVHRDLKPENLFLTRSGPTKILDFGVAKLLQGSPVPGNQPATVAGMLVGTAGYLAPEQILCEAVDARADLFALGAILYEMLTGRSAFGREHAIDTLHAVLHEPVPSPGGEPGVVSGMAPITDRLLEKDPDARFQSAADLAWTLERLSAGGIVAPPPVRTPRASFRWGTLMVAAAIGGALALVAGLAVWTLKPGATHHPSAVARLSVSLPVGDTIELIWPAMALSADGRLLAYTAARAMRPAQLFVRAIDSLEVTLVTGTEGAKSPFFSPDGRWIGFFAQGKLKKVLATGGGLQIVCDAASAFGGTWGADGSIYFAPFNTSGIWQVPASGGSPREVTRVDRTQGEVSHRWPQISPDGKVLFFTVWTGPGWDEKHLAARIADSGEQRRLVSGASTGRYLSTGHLLYARNEELFVVPFDLAQVRVTGVPVTLVDRASEQADSGEGAQITASDSGTLAYVRSDARASDRRMVWVGTDGSVQPLSSPPGAYTNPAISPNGRSVAVSIQGPTQNLWIYDLARSTLTILPSAGSSQAPIWTPDGRRLIYRRTQAGYRNIFWRAADGSGDEERLTTADALQAPSTVSQDGVNVLFEEVSPETGRDMWMLRLDAGRRRQAVLNTRFNEWSAGLSPDNRWLAYVSDESGRNEVYLRPYPAPGGKFLISTTGGREPVWSRDGRELFYRNGDKMMAVTIAAGSTPAPGAPHLLFEGHYQIADAGVAGYDVSSDRRFLMIESTVPLRPVTHITVVLNWFEELKRAVPGATK